MRVIFAAMAATAISLVGIPFARDTPIGAILSGPAWWENLTLFGLLFAAVAGVLFVIGRMTASDLGLRLDKLGQGLIVTVLAWGLMQAWPYIASGSVQLATTWSEPGVLATLRWAAVMLLTTALVEEVIFRGFLLPQAYLRTRGPRWLRLSLALLASQLIFASAHIPAHIVIRDLEGAALAQMLLLQGVAGILLGLVYFRTRNLWICVGLHGLVNAPTPLFSGAMTWELPLLIILVGWPWLVRRREHKGFASVETGNATASSRQHEVVR